MFTVKGVLPTEKIVVFDDKRGRVFPKPVTPLWLNRVSKNRPTHTRFRPLGIAKPGFFDALKANPAMPMLEAEEILNRPPEQEPEKPVKQPPEPAAEAQESEGENKPSYSKSAVARMSADKLDEVAHELDIELLEGWSGLSLTKKRNHIKSKL